MTGYEMIINCPEYAKDYEFVVVTLIDSDYWFWGAYSNGFKADRIAHEIGGLVIHNVRIQGKRA